MYECLRRLQTRSHRGNQRTFPNVICDGQISAMVLHGGNHSIKEPFPLGMEVQVHINEEYVKGTVSSVPIGEDLSNYLVKFPDHSEPVEAPLELLPALDVPVYNMIREFSYDDFYGSTTRTE
jgi:hypothetical protein